jgi:hypothetical protein
MFYLVSMMYFRIPYDCSKDPEMIDITDTRRRVTLEAWSGVPPSNRCFVRKVRFARAREARGTEAV